MRRRGPLLAMVSLVLVCVLPGPAVLGKEPVGLVIESVAPDSPAAKAGLRVGDRLLDYDGKPLPSPDALRAGQENTFGKTEVSVRLQRGDEKLSLTVPPGKLGLTVRPELVAAVLALYEVGRAAVDANRPDEAVEKWTMAAKAAEEAGDNRTAAWLHGRVGEVQERQAARKGAARWKAAQEAYAAAWALLTDSSDLALRSSTVSALGRCCQSLSDFPAAQAWFEQARQVDEMWLAEDLNALGVVAWSRGKLPTAQDYWTRTLSIRERLVPDSLQVAWSLNNLGLVAAERGQLAEAWDYYTRALAAKERLVPDSLDLAITLNNLGNVARDRGDLDASRSYHSRALAIRERVAPDSLDIASSLANLGIVAWLRGDLQAAHDFEIRALAVHERMAPGSLQVAWSLNNLGNVAQARGDLRTAREHFARSLAIKERLAPDSLDLAITLNNLGNVARDRGDLSASRSYHSRALAIRERLAPDSLDIASSLTNLGNVAWFRGDLEAAHDYYTRALGIQERVAPDSLHVAWSLNNLGNVAHERCDLSAARDWFSRSLAIKERLAPRSLDEAITLNNLGNVAHDRGDLVAAGDHHTRALAIRERLAPESLEAAISLSNLGDLVLAERRPAEALSLFLRAATLVEGQRRQVASAESRALLTAHNTYPYTGLLQTYCTLGDLPAAFASVERARARGLVEMLAEREADLPLDAPVELLSKHEALASRRVNAYSLLGKLDPAKDAERIAQLHAEIEGLAAERRELTAEIRRASPRYAALQYPEPPDLKQVRASLDAGTLLLTYCVDEQETYLFAVTRSALKLYRAKRTAKVLAEGVLAFREAVASPRGRCDQRARELYNLLVRPAQRLVNQAGRVLICPDGPLHLLPFAALVTTPAPHVRYFVEDKPLHTIVSMGVYAELNKAPVRPVAPLTSYPVTRSPLLLAMGDPVYGGGSEVAQKAAGEFQTRGAKLTPLLHSRREVEAIGSLYGRQAVLRLGAEATESAAKTESPKASILHFACHGLLDDKDPLGSALALTPGSDNDDGLLRACEVMEKLRLNADLVVLSACQSGLGQETKSEGIVGMTRAFQCAGARSVVVSLWNVADESTAALMTEFYRHLKVGKPKDEALRAAQLSLLHPNPKSQIRNRKSFSHPYYWAAFALVGDWR